MISMVGSLGHATAGQLNAAVRSPFASINRPQRQCCLTAFLTLSTAEALRVGSRSGGSVDRVVYGIERVTQTLQTAVERRVGGLKSERGASKLLTAGCLVR
jgi:hypothetical protein